MTDQSSLRQGLGKLEGMISKMEGGDRIDIAGAAALLKDFRSLEQIEEQGLVAAAEGALRSRKGSDFVRTSRQLTVVLRNHLEKEGAEQQSVT